MYYIQTKARSNSTKFNKTVCLMEKIEDVKHYLNEKKLSVLPKPYFFTHLKLSDGTIIIQTVVVRSDQKELLVSPVALAKELNIN